jgi:lambda family phage tail tape measure protein
MAVGSLGQLTVDLVANTAGFERGMNQAERALASATKEAKRQEDALERLIGQIDPTVAAYGRLDKMEQQLEAHRKAGRLPTEDYKQYKAQLDATRASLAQTDAALTKGGLTAKQLANNLRGVPAQFTDIAVSLASGQQPLTVLLQQGGQLKDMFGGIGPAASALGGYIVGLINPFTILAATLGTITALFIDAEKEASAFNKALFSGSASSGQTASSLSQLSEDAATLTGRLGEAKTAVIALASATGLSETQFRNLAIAATAIGEFTGKSAADVAKSLGDLGDNATVAAQKISAQYGLITNEQYEVIKALDLQGKKQEALDVLSATLAENAQARLKTYRESLSDLERDWDDIGTAISNAYSKVRGELFPDAAKQIELLERVLQTRREGGVAGAISTGLGELATTLGLAEETTDALEKQLALLKQAETSKKAAAEASGKEIRDNQALIKLDAERMKAAKSAPAPRAFREDAGQRMLDTLRQQAAALQLQSETNDKLGTQAKALAAFEQQIADIKSKDIQTADQKSLLASEDLLRAQLKRNVALEQEVAARKQATEEAGKLAAFQENQRSKITSAKEANQSQLEGLGSGEKLRERLKTNLAIEKEYQNEQDKLEAQRSKNQISPERYKEETAILKESLAERLVDQQDYYNQLDEAQGSFFIGASEAWANWSDEAQNYSAQAAQFVTGTLDTLSDGLAETFMSILDGTKSVGDAFADLGAMMVEAVVGALVKMAAQWLVYQAVQLLVGSTTSAASIAQASLTGTAIAAAYAPAAALASLASFGANSIPATAAILSTTAIAEGVALAGMAHDGIDSVPQTGTWLLQKGERVTTAQTSAKLDKTLNDISSPSNMGSTTVNLIENPDRAGERETRTGPNGEEQLDVFVADLLGDGKTAQAFERKYNLQTVGR